MSSLWFGILPVEMLDKIGPLSMILVGYLVEKKYISRPSLFMNTIALNTYFVARGITNPIWVWYANIGLIFGIIAIIAYGLKENLFSAFYTIGYAYSSVPVGLIILGVT